MSKVVNIKNHLIPFLSKQSNLSLTEIDKVWYLDQNSKLYKLKIYEDGYSISNDSDFPEEISNLPKENIYNVFNIYLEKVTRNTFVNNKDSVIKFSFNRNENIYYYLCDKIIEKEQQFNDIQINSKKRKRKYSEDYSRFSDEISVDWSQMVSASRVRNYLLNDTLIDWLSEYNVTSINNDVSKCLPNSLSKSSNFDQDYKIDEFTKHIMEQGILFEKEVIDLLGKNFQIVQASESFQAREVRNFEYTKKLMKEGVPIIYQAVLHDYESKTYGCPDILVRSDYVNKIFNSEVIEESKTNCRSLLLGTDFYYIVIDIKHSTLHFNVDFKTLRNRDSIPAYKGQLYVYNEALSKIQGYNPKKALIIGKMWNWKNMSGNNFLEKPGIVDYNDFDSNYEEQTKDAIKWVLRVRNEGSRWKLTPLPSIPELYPNMNNEKDGHWKYIKKELAESINEITSLWMCGIKNRQIAHGNHISGFKDPECSAENLGFKEGKIADTLDKIISINRNEESDKLILPNKIKTSTIDSFNWRTMNEDSLEFYLDYETMNSNLGRVFVEDNNIGYQENQFIFQIGVGYLKNDKWTYKSFIAPTHDLMGEVSMINNFWNYIKKVKKEENKEKEHFVHWYNAEPISYNKLKERVKKVGINLESMMFVDLYKLFRQEPITVKGSLNFSLKSIAKAMNKLKLIKTNWDSNNPCSNGLNAMLLAHKAYEQAKEPITEKNVIMNNIVHYNQVDCKVLWEIISYIRNNN